MGLYTDKSATQLCQTGSEARSTLFGTGNGTLPVVDSYSFPALLHILVSFFNLFIQISAIYFVYSRKKYKEGSFFLLLLVLSSTVSIRITSSIIFLSTASFLTFKSLEFFICCQISLYFDYISDFFSLQIIFLLSLNRCLCFTKTHWNDRIFVGKRWIYSVVPCGLLSILSAVTVIKTSEVIREYRGSVGFVEYGAPFGLRVLLNRLFFVFPIGSVLCYFILYLHLQKENKKFEISSSRTQGKKNVYTQLLATAGLYLSIWLIFELITYVSWLDENNHISVLIILNVSNNLPEISLPLLILTRKLEIRRRISKFLAPLPSVIVVPRNESTV